MAAAFVSGLLGAALGIVLYRLGFWAARRTPVRTRAEKAAPAPSSVPTVPGAVQEWYNFLNYDGSEMEKAEK